MFYDKIKEEKMSTKSKNTYTLKDDVAFKVFFGKPGNEKFLKSFLEALLNVKINKIEIMQEASLKQLNLKYKNGRLDIKATINNSEIVNIEMQVGNNHNMNKRTLYYGSRLVSEQLASGDVYEDIKPVILINILNFNFLDVLEYHTETVLVAKEHRDYEIIKDIKYHFIELPKFRKQKPELNNELDCWLALIDCESEELIAMAEKKSPIIKEAKEKYEEILSEGILKEIKEYEETSRLELASYGYRVKKENSKAIAIELLKKGMDVDFIHQTTKLSIDEIKDLQKQL
jgi:predicted transposase/invertase (TIGR01784 family)